MQNRDHTNNLLVVDELVDDSVAADPQRAQAAELVPEGRFVLEQTECVLNRVNLQTVSEQPVIYRDLTWWQYRAGPKNARCVRASLL